MPKVLIVATSRKTKGGISSVIESHEKGRHWKDFKCHWVVTHRDGWIGRKLFYLGCGYLDFLSRILFYDIVHFHVSLGSTVKRKLPLFKIAKLLSKKTIVHLHCGTQIDEIWNEQYSYMFEKADRILVLSNCLQEKILSKTMRKDNVQILFNPCPTVTKSDIQKQKVILFFGSINEGKGYKDLLDAFAKIAKKQPEWKVIFAGNGEILEGLSRAKQLDIENQVEFVGWVAGKSKSDLFNRASIFCLPSYAEGFPMAVLEAWAYGLPVITTPVGGIPDVAIDGENMLLFNPGDTYKLAENIGRLITDDELRKKISKASSEFASRQFNIKTINNQLADIYRSLEKKE